MSLQINTLHNTGFNNPGQQSATVPEKQLQKEHCKD